MFREIYVTDSRLRRLDAGHLHRVSILRRLTGDAFLIRSNGTQGLLFSLAMEKVDKCPFPPDAVASLKKELIDSAALYGLHLERRTRDRSDVPIDYRFLHVLLQSAGDPVFGLGEYSQGVRVWSGNKDAKASGFVPS